MPAAISVLPAYVLIPVRIVLPAPFLTKLPMPSKVPAMVSVEFAIGATVIFALALIEVSADVFN